MSDDYDDESSIRCLIKKEGSWSEIEVEESKTLDEKAQWFEKQSKTINTNLILNIKIVDINRN